MRRADPCVAHVCLHGRKNLFLPSTTKEDTAMKLAAQLFTIRDFTKNETDIYASL